MNSTPNDFEPMPPSQVPVRYAFSPDLVALLVKEQSTLAITTYQASRIILFRATPEGRLSALLREYDQPMGVAVDSKQMAIATRNQVVCLKNATDIGVQLEPQGTHDACYLPRQSYFTGDIRGHEIGWDRSGQLHLVNTRFSCLCRLAEDYSFISTWKPPFISTLTPDDRCHLNGVAFDDEGPKYVTALGATDEPEGWRERRVDGGILMDVTSNEVIASGLCMPHSPRIYDDRLWVLNSGCGQLLTIDPNTGDKQIVAQLPGFTRGLTFIGGYAFVGLSKIRETSTFGGVPIAENIDNLRCGIAMVNLASGEFNIAIDFEAGVTELFDVQSISGVRFPALMGTNQEAIDTIFVSPEFSRH